MGAPRGSLSPMGPPAPPPGHPPGSLPLPGPVRGSQMPVPLGAGQGGRPGTTASPGATPQPSGPQGEVDCPGGGGWAPEPARGAPCQSSAVWVGIRVVSPWARSQPPRDPRAHWLGPHGPQGPGAARRGPPGVSGLYILVPPPLARSGGGTGPWHWPGGGDGGWPWEPGSREGVWRCVQGITGPSRPPSPRAAPGATGPWPPLPLGGVVPWPRGAGSGEGMVP